MPPTRIKESCLPCRQRRSRCDGALPCAPCTVHRTGSECNYASGKANGRRSASPQHLPVASPASNGEVHQLRSSVQALETRIELLERQLGFEHATPHGRPSGEDRDRWTRLKAALPPLSVCEILLDYFLVECDWLWWSADVSPIWKGAVANAACTDTEAGFMAISLAYASLLLGFSFYNINISPTLHTEMFELARAHISGEGVLEADLLSAISMYVVYAGRVDETKPFVDGAITMAVKLELLDESLPSWRGLSWEEMENRRRVAWQIIVQCRWSYLARPAHPLLSLRQNVCQPQWNPHPAEILHLSDESRPLRLFRVQSKYEMERTRAAKTLMVDYTSLFRRLQAYLASGDHSATECESIYRELAHYRDIKLPASGFDDPATSTFDFTDPISARDASQRIIMHHAFGHLLFITLRHWLTDTSTDPLVQTLREASVDGAMRTMASVPMIKAFSQSKQGPFISTFAASNMFSAAMIFAVPILRAMKSATELDELHEWPAIKKQVDKTITPMPASSFTDPTIRYCANNIVLLLDAMVALNDNPLREIIEEKVSALIDKYGLRQAVDVVPAPSLEWMNPFPWPTGEPEQDILQQLLQMDSSVWQAWLGNNS